MQVIESGSVTPSTRTKRNFIEIGNTTYESADQIKGRTGISESTLWRYMRVNSFPSPIRVGNRRFYEVEAVDAWLRTRR